MRLLLPVLALSLLACGRTDLVHYSFLPGDGGVPDAGRVLVPCVTGELTPLPAVPAVMLVVDRSGSMDLDLAGNRGGLFGNPLTGPRRWAVLRSSLQSTLTQFDELIAFGMVQFPADDDCGVSATIDLVPKAGNANEVLARFNRIPGGGTPTAEAVTTAADQLAAVKGQALVLITDGEPNCNGDLDPLTCDCSGPSGGGSACFDAKDCRDNVRTVERVRQLRADRAIVTYVVGVGSSSTTVIQTLDDMAIAGGVPRVGGARSFYSGTTEAELSEALNAISTRLSRCTWATGTKLGPNDFVTVTVGGEEVPHGELGWDWVDASSGDFSLRGNWCARAAAGEAVLVRLECR